MFLSIAASRALWYVSTRLKGRLSDLELDILNEGCRFKSPPLHANPESAEKFSDGMSLFRCVSTLLAAEHSTTSIRVLTRSKAEFPSIRNTELPKIR